MVLFSVKWSQSEKRLFWSTESTEELRKGWEVRVRKETQGQDHLPSQPASPPPRTRGRARPRLRYQGHTTLLTAAGMSCLCCASSAFSPSSCVTMSALHPGTGRLSGVVWITAVVVCNSRASTTSQGAMLQKMRTYGPLVFRSAYGGSFTACICNWAEAMYTMHTALWCRLFSPYCWLSWEAKARNGCNITAALEQWRCSGHPEPSPPIPIRGNGRYMEKNTFGVHRKSAQQRTEELSSQVEKKRAGWSRALNW